jgi:membrane protease YdiL (CAAX protease family)
MRMPRALSAPWPALLTQQLGLVAVLGLAMRGLQWATGRNLRGLADRPHLVDLLVYAVVTSALIGASIALARGVEPSALPSWRSMLGRWRSLGVGFVIGATLNTIPWTLAVVRGDATVGDAFSGRVTATAVLTGLLLAVWNAGFEEVTSRAVPLTITRRWRPAYSVIVTSLLFALMHGIGESLSPSRVLYLFSLGVVFAICWVVTGSVALGTGVHAGWFWASLVPSGRAASGALLQVDGDVGRYVQWTDTVLAVVAIAGIAWLLRRSRTPHFSPS